MIRSRIPATNTYCADKGQHAATDAKGRCMNCGEKIKFTMLETVAAFKKTRNQPGSSTSAPPIAPQRGD